MVGKILYSLPFAVFGVMNLMYAQPLSIVVPHWLPGGVIWVYVVGAVFIVASLAIMASIRVKEAALSIAAVLAAIIVTVHVPGLQNPSQMQTSLTNLLKDTALMGAALLIAGMHWQAGGGSCRSERMMADMEGVMAVEEGCCGGGCCGEEEA